MRTWRQRAIVETINLPVLGASGLIFGGPDNDILFVVIFFQFIANTHAYSVSLD